MERSRSKETGKNFLKNKKLLKSKEDLRKKEYKKDISDFVSKNEKIGPLTLTKSDKKDIVSYITDRNVKLKNGQSISSFYADLESVLSKKETLLQLAKLLRLRDRTGNFDFKEIEKRYSIFSYKEFKKIKSTKKKIDLYPQETGAERIK